MAIVTQSGVLAILFFRFKGSSKSHCCNTDGLDILMKFFKEGNSFCSFVLLFLCTSVRYTSLRSGSYDQKDSAKLGTNHRRSSRCHGGNRLEWPEGLPLRYISVKSCSIPFTCVGIVELPAQVLNRMGGLHFGLRPGEEEAFHQ